MWSCSLDRVSKTFFNSFFLFKSIKKWFLVSVLLFLSIEIEYVYSICRLSFNLLPMKPLDPMTKEHFFFINHYHNKKISYYLACFSLPSPDQKESFPELVPQKKSLEPIQVLSLPLKNLPIKTPLLQDDNI